MQPTKKPQELLCGFFSSGLSTLLLTGKFPSLLGADTTAKMAGMPDAKLSGTRGALSSSALLVSRRLVVYLK